MWTAGNLALWTFQEVESNGKGEGKCSGSGQFPGTSEFPLRLV